MSLLFSENPLVVNPELAEKIGLNEAIILQQIHYWVQKSNFKHDGKFWVYNTIEQWREQFRFFSADTIKRTLKKLKDAGLIRVERLSEDKRDRTNYYTIDYKKLESLEPARCNGAKCTDGEVQNAPMSEGKMHRCINDKSFDRDYTETTTENTPNPSCEHPEPQGESDRTRAGALKKLDVIKTECALVGAKGRLSQREFSEASKLAEKIDDPMAFVRAFKEHLMKEGRYAKRLINFLADYAAQKRQSEERPRRRVRDGFVEEFKPEFGDWFCIGPVGEVDA
ncbi:hypothetical protein [Hydrogenimonas sp.]